VKNKITRKRRNKLQWSKLARNLHRVLYSESTLEISR